MTNGEWFQTLNAFQRYFVARKVICDIVNKPNIPNILDEETENKLKEWDKAEHKVEDEDKIPFLHDFEDAK